MGLGTVKTFEIGDGMTDSTTHAPLIHGCAVAKVDKHVRDAVKVKKDARVLYSVERLALGPNFIGITILADMKPGMRICTE